MPAATRRQPDRRIIGVQIAAAPATGHPRRASQPTPTATTTPRQSQSRSVCGASVCEALVRAGSTATEAQFQPRVIRHTSAAIAATTTISHGAAAPARSVRKREPDVETTLRSILGTNDRIGDPMSALLQEMPENPDQERPHMVRVRQTARMLPRIAAGADKSGSMPPGLRRRCESATTSRPGRIGTRSQARRRHGRADRVRLRYSSPHHRMSMPTGPPHDYWRPASASRPAHPRRPARPGLAAGRVDHG
jgi:hypothetical protein